MEEQKKQYNNRKKKKIYSINEEKKTIYICTQNITQQLSAYFFNDFTNFPENV